MNSCKKMGVFGAEHTEVNESFSTLLLKNFLLCSIEGECHWNQNSSFPFGFEVQAVIVPTSSSSAVWAQSCPPLMLISHQQPWPGSPYQCNLYRDLGVGLNFFQNTNESKIHCLLVF